MRRRRLVIIMVMVLLVGYPAYKSGMFATVGVDVERVCSHGVAVGIREGTVFRPGREVYPAYDVDDVRIRMGRQEAHIGGGYPIGADVIQEFIGADLVAGESVVHRGVGTFTLLTVDPMLIQLMPGAGGTATFCFTPAPEFDLNPGLARLIYGPPRKTADTLIPAHPPARGGRRGSSAEPGAEGLPEGGADPHAPQHSAGGDRRAAGRLPAHDLAGHRGPDRGDRPGPEGRAAHRPGGAPGLRPRGGRRPPPPLEPAESPRIAVAVSTGRPA